MSEKDPTPISKNSTAFSLDSYRDGIRNRILEVRNNHGYTNNEDFSKLLFGYVDKAKTITTWTREKDPKTPTIENLALIAFKTGVSLDWLVFGKSEQLQETPPAPQEVEDTAIPKKAVQNSICYKDKERAMDNEINQLLSNFRQPVLKISAAFLNLFKYANISIVGDYDAYNFNAPQSLTIKISPKCFSVKGRYVEEEEAFYSVDRYFDHFAPLNTGLGAYDNLDQIVYWDIRTTLIQSLMATACRQNEKQYLNPFTLLRSIYLTMKYDIDDIGYNECLKSSNIGYLSNFSITDIDESKALREGIFPLYPCKNAYLNAKNKCHPLPMISKISNSKMPNVFVLDTDSLLVEFTDSLCCTLNCEYEKIPSDIKDTLIEF